MNVLYYSSNVGPRHKNLACNYEGRFSAAVISFVAQIHLENWTSLLLHTVNIRRGSKSERYIGLTVFQVNSKLCLG